MGIDRLESSLEASPTAEMSPVSAEGVVAVSGVYARQQTAEVADLEQLADEVHGLQLRDVIRTPQEPAHHLHERMVHPPLTLGQAGEFPAG